MSFVFYFTHADFSSPPAMLRSIGYPSDNRSGRKWVVRVIKDLEPVIIQFLLLHLNIPSFLAFGPVKSALLSSYFVATFSEYALSNIALVCYTRDV